MALGSLIVLGFGGRVYFSTRCGAQGVTIFYGMAKPVRAPQIGLARQP